MKTYMYIYHFILICPMPTAHAKERPQLYKLQNFLICLMLVVMTAQILLQLR